MTLAALIDAGVDVAAIRAAVASLNLPDVRVVVEPVVRCGFRALHVRVEHPEQHVHRNLHDINSLIDNATGMTPAQKDLARRIFLAVARAEAKVHHAALDQVHFHEVGAIDSIVDIVGAAVGFDLLGAAEVVCSPVPPGRGHVHIAHGVCSVPTPGTAELLKGIPLVDVPVAAELTTPTGAAILSTLVDRFGPLPDMTLESIGYGAGTRDFTDRANVLRLFVGVAAPKDAETDQVLILETNLDDVTGEIIGYTRQKLLAAGALDVFSQSIQMKKDRPGTLLTVISRPADREKLEEILFAETATFGIRHRVVERSIRQRRAVEAVTPWGPVRGKLGWRSNGDVVFTPEFEACAEIAALHGVPLREVFRAAECAAPAGPQPLSPVRDQAPGREHTHDHDHDHDHRYDSGHDHDH